MPKKSASTEAWQSYAISKGMDAEQAQAMTRDQLVEHYAAADEGTGS
jgi:hypothetical protein